MRIAVLFHAAERDSSPSNYIVHHLAACWREDGHEVVYLYGPRRREPADILFVHVNLSVVPAEYLGFAASYPVALNARLRDIRKSAISANLVQAGDDWPGPVIVKSDLNYGGLPEDALGTNWLEQRFAPWRRAARRWPGLFRSARLITDWRDYRVYARIEDVPAELRRSRNVVVEKFRPELDEGLYHLRIYQFLGERHTCARLVSREPVVKAQNSIRVESSEPHPEVQSWRRRLRMDYGKIDYVVNGGEAVLLDVNKTTGASRRMANADLSAMRRHLAEGLYGFFTGTRHL
jgi:hypothetical protein